MPGRGAGALTAPRGAGRSGLVTASAGLRGAPLTPRRSAGRALPSGRVSVIAPPEVERPYDQAWEPYAERVTRYRTWTRTRQASLVGVSLTALALATAISVIGGRPPWESPVGELAIQVLVIFVAFTGYEVLWEGRGLRRRVAAAEPLPDGALEVGPPVLRALVEPSFLLRGVLLGAVFGAGALLLGDDTSRIVVAVLIGMGAGRLLGLELLLRLVVERADPLRTFYVSLDAEELDSPLLWRSAI